MLFSCITGAIAFRVGMAVFWQVSPVTHYLTPSCLDALGIGGYLAYVQHFDGADRLQRVARFLGAIGCLGLLIMLGLKKLTHIEEFEIVGHTFLVLFFGFLVGRAAKGFSGVFGRLLNLKPAQYLGKISYGIYVYHHLAPWAVATLLAAVGLRGAFSGHLPFLLLLYGAFTLGTAAASWHFYESPVNELKRYFEYPRAKSPAQPSG